MNTNYTNRFQRDGEFATPKGAVREEDIRKGIDKIRELAGGIYQDHINQTVEFKNEKASDIWMIATDLLRKLDGQYPSYIQYKEEETAAETIIKYIENDCECAIPIEAMFKEDGSHITKGEYGIVLLKTLCNELRTKFLPTKEKANNLIQEQ